MRNSRISKYKKVTYFVNKNNNRWEVVEFPTNDIVRTFKNKRDAQLLSEQLMRVKPFGENIPLPKFMKGQRELDITE